MMTEPTNEQKLVAIPVMCQLLVEFLEDTAGNSCYVRELKFHSKQLISSSDKFMDAVYGCAKSKEHSAILADEQNNIAVMLKTEIANRISIQV